jgi:hypothetical protein
VPNGGHPRDGARPMSSSYVAAAYGVVLFGLLLYVVVIGLRSARQAREAELLARLVERQVDAGDERQSAALEPVDR